MTRAVFLDLETTGLDQERHEIWEIGAIVRTAPEAVGDEPADTEYHWQIRPDLSTADPTGLRIGRYYERIMDADADPGTGWLIDGDEAIRVPLREIAANLAELLDGAHVIGAVPWFDERFLQRFLRSHNQAATNHYHLIDVEAYAAGARNMPPPWNFDQILEEWGLNYDEADRHTALGDARMARDLYDAVTGGGKA